MSRLVTGFLLGVGIGLLVAPMRGEEMQRVLRERSRELRRRLPEQEQLQQAGQEATAALSHLARGAKEAVSPAADQGLRAGTNVREQAGASVKSLKQTAQEEARILKKTPAREQPGTPPTTNTDEREEDTATLLDLVQRNEGAAGPSSEPS